MIRPLGYPSVPGFAPAYSTQWHRIVSYDTSNVPHCILIPKQQFQISAADFSAVFDHFLLATLFPFLKNLPDDSQPFKLVFRRSGVGTLIRTTSSGRNGKYRCILSTLHFPTLFSNPLLRIVASEMVCTWFLKFLVRINQNESWLGVSLTQVYNIIYYIYFRIIHLTPITCVVKTRFEYLFLSVPHPNSLFIMSWVTW